MEKLKLLVIEDNPDDAVFISRLLKKSKTCRFDLSYASRFSEARRLLVENNFDAIVLDLSLPDGRGEDLFSKVYNRAHEVPIILFSGSEDPSLATKLLAQGAQDFLQKDGNVSSDILVNTILFAVARTAFAKKKEEAIHVLKEPAIKYKTTVVSEESNLAPIYEYSEDANSSDVDVKTNLRDSKKAFIPRLSSEEDIPINDAILSDINIKNKATSFKGFNVRQLSTESLEQQIRELHCMYGITKVLEQQDSTLDDILLQTIAVLDESFRVDACINIRIVLQDKSYQSSYFSETKEKLEEPLLFYAKDYGVIQIFYNNADKEDLSVARIEEDKKLLHAVSVRLGKIIERYHARERLNHTLLELNRSNEELEQFAYIASHDLKEPLRTIINTLKLIKDDTQNLSQEETVAKIGASLSSAKRMRTLVSDLLAFAKVNKQAKDFVLVDLHQVVQDVLNNLQGSIKEKSVKITVASLPAVKGNPIQLMQLFQNIISNSIKYCELTPIIDISVDNAEDSIVFCIKDNGIGVPSDQKKKIFEPFYRLQTKTAFSGTGIGLALCKKIVKAHGGKIWVKSSKLTGSSFYFTLNS
jgi:signal transduction histidine kinase/DNA-binding NarL/FixJ family response regulator